MTPRLSTLDTLPPDEALAALEEMERVLADARKPYLASCKKCGGYSDAAQPPYPTTTCEACGGDTHVRPKPETDNAHRAIIGWALHDGPMPALLRLARKALAPPTPDTAKVRELVHRFTYEDNSEDVALDLRDEALTLASAYDALAVRVAEAERVGEDRAVEAALAVWLVMDGDDEERERMCDEFAGPREAILARLGRTASPPPGGTITP